MKFLFDLFPVILFFVAFRLADIYVATAAAIAATFLQIGILALLKRKIDTMLWVSLAIIVLFGGATLLLRDETFIKWKPTVLYWLFAAVLAVSVLAFGKNLIRAMLAAQVEVPEPVWERLNWSWAGFFAFMSVANLFVAYSFPTDPARLPPARPAGSAARSPPSSCGSDRRAAGTRAPARCRTRRSRRRNPRSSSAAAAATARAAAGGRRR